MAQLIRFLRDQKIPATQARLPQESVVISDRTRHANKLGEGSFAKVYRGEYNGKPCAVKIFKEDVLRKEFSPDPESEVEMLSKVRHTNIVQLYGMWYDPHKERAAIVMEICDESVHEFIRRYKGKIVAKEMKLLILRDIARGMVYLHGQNIIHGDLRSSNILLVHSEDQTVAKLADFDMAKLLDPDTQRCLTNSFTDEEYLPPEVFDHKEAKDPKKKWALLTPKVDVFCFGEVVLEVGCGSYPKPVSKYNDREMLTELKRRDKYLVKLRQSDKESLGVVVRKCLADAPDSRPDFTEILLEVEGYLHQYGERPDLEKLQDKTAECEVLRAQALKWEDDSKSLCSAQDRVDLLESELDITREEKQDLQHQLYTPKRMSEVTETELMGRLTESQQQLTKEREMTATERKMDEKRGNEKVAKLEGQLIQAETLKVKAEKERIIAVSDKEQTKRELEQLRARLTGELERLQAETAAGDKTIASQQQKLKEAQQRELELNANLRQYRDQLSAMESARDKLERSKETLEDGKVALDKQVRELTIKLGMRTEDLDKKEKKVFDLMRGLEETQKAMEEGNELEPILRQCIEELEKSKEYLTNELEETDAKLKGVEKELTEAKEMHKTLEEKLDQKITAIRALEDECDRQNYKVRELEGTLSDMTARNEELKEQCDREAYSCRLAKCDLEAAMATLAEKREMLSAKDVKLSKFEKELAHSQTECDKVRAQLVEVNHEADMKLEKLEGKLNHSEDLNAKLLEEKRIQEERESALQDTVKQLEQQKSDLTSDTADLREQMRILSQDNATLEDDLHQAQEKHEEAQRGYSSSQTKLDQQGKTVNDQASKIVELERQLYEAKAVEDGLKSEIARRAKLKDDRDKSEKEHEKAFQSAIDALAECHRKVSGVKDKVTSHPISGTQDLIKALKGRLDPKWREFGFFLGVDYVRMNTIEADHSKVTECMLQLVSQWMNYTSNTGGHPRTWKTVVKAVKDTGDGVLAEELAAKYGITILTAVKAMNESVFGGVVTESATSHLEGRDAESIVPHPARMEFHTMLELFKRELEETREVIKQGQSLEPQQKQRVTELEEGNEDLKVRNAELQGQLTENYRAEEVNRNELQTATQKRAAAEVEMSRAQEEQKKAEDKHLETLDRMDQLREEFEEAKRQLKELEEVRSKASDLEKRNISLQDRLSDLEKEHSSAQEKVSDQETAKDKLQASFREEIGEAIRQQNELKIKNAELQGQLTEYHRAEEVNRNELQAATHKRVAAEVEKTRAREEHKWAEQKHLETLDRMDQLREEVREAKTQLKELEEVRSTASDLQKRNLSLQDRLSALEKDHSSVQEKVSDLEAAKDKLQASLKYVEVERDDYQKKSADSNKWIMQQLQTQDKEGSPGALPVRTEFHTMMEFFKVYYDKSSEQSEYTAEENQRLRANNSELKEKMQELGQASQALQEKLSEKQKCLDEEKRKILSLKSQLASFHGQELDDVPLSPVPASDVVEHTDAEGLLQKLCYMAMDIEELLVGPNGGTFVLGRGDARLEFPQGAVEKKTYVRYAIILHGPFVFPAGYTSGSVVVYLNMDRAVLMKPVLLFLSHWCNTEEEDEEGSLKFARAPHILGEEQNYYEFDEQEEADFITHSDVGILKILKPQCMHCVKGKIGKIARYSVITFTREIPSPEDELHFRIQLMCDSREWNECMALALNRGGWNKTSSGDIVTRFEYASRRKPIAASPHELKGSGWKAYIEGKTDIKLREFLLPKARTKPEIEEELRAGHELFPPCILYKVFYSVTKEQRVIPAQLSVAVQGEDLDLRFNCRIKEAKTSSEESSKHSEIQHTADVIRALNHQLDANWRDYGTFLRVEPALMNSIKKDKSDGGPCMLQLIEKWLNREGGTGDLPRTWETVVLAVNGVGINGVLAQQLAEKHGVQLSSGQ